MAAQRILIVDDEPDFVWTINDRLTFEGYESVGAASAEEARTIIAHQPPALIVLDIMMPGIDGIAFFKQLRSNAATADIPVIFVSVRGDALDDPAVSTDRHCRILRKPFDMEALISIVKESLGS